MSSDDSGFNFGEDSIYEVEEIVAVKKRKNGTLRFRVRWQGFGPDDDTWEPRENLLTCEGIVSDYIAAHPELSDILATAFPAQVQAVAARNAAQPPKGEEVHTFPAKKKGGRPARQVVASAVSPTPAVLPLPTKRKYVRKQKPGIASAATESAPKTGEVKRKRKQMPATDEKQSSGKDAGDGGGADATTAKRRQAFCADDDSSSSNGGEDVAAAAARRASTAKRVKKQPVEMASNTAPSQPEHAPAKLSNAEQGRPRSFNNSGGLLDSETDNSFHNGDDDDDDEQIPKRSLSGIFSDSAADSVSPMKVDTNVPGLPDAGNKPSVPSRSAFQALSATLSSGPKGIVQHEGKDSSPASLVPEGTLSAMHRGINMPFADQHCTKLVRTTSTKQASEPVPVLATSSATLQSAQVSQAASSSTGVPAIRPSSHGSGPSDPRSRVTSLAAVSTVVGVVSAGASPGTVSTATSTTVGAVTVSCHPGSARSATTATSDGRAALPRTLNEQTRHSAHRASAPPTDDGPLWKPPDTMASSPVNRLSPKPTAAVLSSRGEASGASRTQLCPPPLEQAPRAQRTGISPADKIANTKAWVKRQSEHRPIGADQWSADSSAAGTNEQVPSHYSMSQIAELEATPAPAAASLAVQYNQVGPQQCPVPQPDSQEFTLNLTDSSENSLDLPFGENLNAKDSGEAGYANAPTSWQFGQGGVSAADPAIASPAAVASGVAPGATGNPTVVAEGVRPKQGEGNQFDFDFDDDESDDVDMFEQQVESAVRATSAEKVPYNMMKDAVKTGNIAVIEQALRSGFDLELVEGMQGVTLLMMAALAGQDASVKKLLSSGATVNVAQKNGVTALMMAAEQGYPSTCDMLLKAGAYVNVPQLNNGETALMKAARRGSIEVVQLLLRAGSNTVLKSHANRTAADYAKMPSVRDLIVTHFTEVTKKVRHHIIAELSKQNIGYVKLPIGPLHCVLPGESTEVNLPFTFQPDPPQPVHVRLFLIRLPTSNNNMQVEWLSAGHASPADVYLNNQRVQASEINSKPVSIYRLWPTKGQNRLRLQITGSLRSSTRTKQQDVVCACIYNISSHI